MDGAGELHVAVPRRAGNRLRQPGQHGHGVHRVAAPGGDRTQITFHEEPVANAQAIPGEDRFLYSRDTGGDEWFQLYVRNLGGGETRQLTEPGTRNQSAVVSKDGRLVLWSRATRGSPDYAILAADPNDPGLRERVYQLEHGARSSIAFVSA